MGCVVWTGCAIFYHNICLCLWYNMYSRHQPAWIIRLESNKVIEIQRSKFTIHQITAKVAWFADSPTLSDSNLRIFLCSAGNVRRKQMPPTRNFNIPTRQQRRRLVRKPPDWFCQSRSRKRAKDRKWFYIRPVAEQRLLMRNHSTTAGRNTSSSNRRKW